jgi:hypothetical protein
VTGSVVLVSDLVSVSVLVLDLRVDLVLVSVYVFFITIPELS